MARRCYLVGLALLGLVACSQPHSVADENKTTATATTPEAAQATVPALIFLQYLNQQAPQLLCQQDPAIACLRMPTELCLASVEQSIERCGPKLLAQWPAEFAETAANAQSYAQSYRNCLLNDWVAEFGLQPERLKACGINLNS